MIEFTILLNDDTLEFEPHQYTDQLQLFFPPTARIDRNDDVVHLAPIPVHCFFNAITFGHWLAEIHNLSQNDAFVAYTIHDMFKAILRMRMDPRRPDSRIWPHQSDYFFNPIKARLQSTNIFDDFSTAFNVASKHRQRIGRKRMAWREAVRHEESAEAGTETWDWSILGLTVRLQSALSNITALAYVKQTFITAYVEAIRAEFPDIFNNYDAVSYRYEFVGPTTLTGNLDKDVPILCSQSDVRLEGRTLVVQTFIGSQPSAVGDTIIRLPFWLLLTLRQDPTSILFPVPTHHQDHHPDPHNTAFSTAVKANFERRIRHLLESMPLTGPAAKSFPAKVDSLMASLDEVCHVFSTTDYELAIKTRTPASAATFCTMCGSEIPKDFACSPKRDLGFSPSNYTDWHIGHPDQICLLCAIANFKAPSALEQTRKLIAHRKVAYFATTTPAASELLIPRPQRLFFDAEVDAIFDPQFSVISLESLVTLNIIGALYLYDTRRRVSISDAKDGRQRLWLEPVNEDPFTFIGLIGSDKGKGYLLDLLTQLQTNLSRPVHLLDAILPLDIEVPFQSLVAVLGVAKPRHFEIKFKPLTTSNHQGTIPVIWEGYHLLDKQALNAARQLAGFVSHFKSRRVNHRMKLTALAAGSATFLDLLVELGGYNYETLYDRLQILSGNRDSMDYLSELRELIYHYPVITELWG
jgi:hypothetical protein